MCVLEVRDMDSGYVWKNQKKLRTGYTTGSCAAGAAKAAAQMLLGEETVKQVKLRTPKGITLYLDVERIVRSQKGVSCAIQKDSGDDPDVTNGIYVYAKVGKTEEAGITIRGGEGVGVVTRKGLEQAVGEPAINRVPRQMIREAVEGVCSSYGYEKGLSVIISIPEGAALAGRTFNPRLGIKGGISVLGTTGIVEPMSEQALVDTIYAEMSVVKGGGYDVCYIVPGNYGSDFLSDTLGYQGDAAVKCSNYIGEAIDIAVRLGMRGILLAGHIGKLIKVAAGIMNTHSHQADGRLEVLAAHAAMAGAGRELVCRIMGCITTSEALALLKEAGILKPVMHTVMEKMERHLVMRAGEGLKVGAVMFEPEYGILGMTDGAEELLDSLERKREEVMVYFVGAGPGAVDLITVRGQRLLEEADVIVYAGSLVNPQLLKSCREGCEIHNSAYMTLEEVIGVMVDAEKKGKKVVRLHTGDPSIYGAIKEQMDALDREGIAYEVCPGVSSFCGAAAALKSEYTLPDISQSVIITRMAGRTPMPERETIRSFAAHQATMVIFLSTGLLRELSKELIEGGYTEDTPAAIVYKATWPEEKVCRCTVGALADTAEAEGIAKTALIIVGRFLDGDYQRSRLYDPAFTTEFRKGSRD